MLQGMQRAGIGKCAGINTSLYMLLPMCNARTQSTKAGSDVTVCTARQQNAVH